MAVFAASGASAGVAKRLDLFGVAFVGVVAALGGGVARDLWCCAGRSTPSAPGLLGAVAVTAASAASLSRPASALTAALLVFVVRVLALYRKWSAPVARAGRG